MRGYSKVQNGISSRSLKPSCNKRKNYKGIFYFIRFLPILITFKKIWNFLWYVSHTSQKDQVLAANSYIWQSEKLLKSNSGRPQASHLTFPGLRSTSVKWGSGWDNTVRLPALKSGMKWSGWLSRVLLFATPWTVSLPRSSIHGIFQARVLEWVAISFFRKIFLTQGSNPGLPHCRHMLYRLSHFRLGSLKIRRLGAKTPESTTINWNAVINLDSGTGRSWCAGIEFCLVLPTW